MSAIALDLDLTLRRELPAAARGDRDAYGRIVSACQNTVTAVAWAITRDVQASEDIAQDTFLSAWKHLGTLKQPDSFLPWIRQIARNRARNHLRSTCQRPLSGPQAELAIELAADTAPTPDERLLQTEEESVAAEVIATLPEDARETLMLYYREGQSSQQVANLLGLTDAAVRKRLSRAREAVRGELLARFGEFARGTAPAAAFTLVVTSALIVAAPPAAAATTLGLAGSAGAKGLGKVLLGGPGGIGAGLAGAGLGIWWGLRRNLRGAIDARERAELKRSALINAAASVVFVLAMCACATLRVGWMPLISLTAIFFGVIFWQSAIVEPRIKARRHAQEASIDPEAAAKRRRRERAMCWLGITLGLVCGGGGLLLAVLRAGLPAF